jgi:hypothetical protein
VDGAKDDREDLVEKDDFSFGNWALWTWARRLATRRP